MSNKLGMHIHGMKPGIIQAIELLQPRTITIMDPTEQEIRDIWSVTVEDPYIVVRKYEDGKSFQQVDPRWWAEETYRLVGNALNDRMIALAFNEPFGHDYRNLCGPFDDWTVAFLERCNELGSMRAGVLPMATGNWTGADNRYKINDDFPNTCELAEYFIPHEYCWPTLQVGVPWYTLRFKTWYEDIGRDDIRLIISEAGLTQGIIEGRADIGWRSGGPEGVTEDSYIATIDWYNAELCKLPWCLGCCLYDYAGSHYGWETFEQLGLENRIFQIQAPEIPEPPEPPNGEEPMVDVYDFDGNLKDWNWLKQNFGDVKIRPIEEMWQPQQGDRVYKVKYFRAKRGYTSCLINVRDRQGKPVVGETVIFGWSSAEEHGYSNKGWNWTDNGVSGDTNSTGDVGPGMGTGAYYAPPDGGPHWCWVWDHPSEMVTGLGMIAGTFHDHVDVGYQEELYDNGEPPPEPPPEPPDDGDLLAVVREQLEVSKRILGHVAVIREIAEREPPDPEPPDPEPPKGYFGEYYNNRSLEGAPAVEQWDDAIFFDWGSGPPVEGVGSDNFSVRWTATREFEAGTWRFHVRVDDGVRLWVDGQLLINDWRDFSPRELTADKVLSAGEHSIKMEYYEHGGGAVAQMWYVKM